MTNQQIKTLQHGEKVRKKEGGPIFMVHNNWRSEGFLVVTRTEIISYNQCADWMQIKQVPLQQLQLEPGTYTVTIERGSD